MSAGHWVVRGLCEEAQPWWIARAAYDPESPITVVVCANRRAAEGLVGPLETWMRWTGEKGWPSGEVRFFPVSDDNLASHQRASDAEARRDVLAELCARMERRGGDDAGPLVLTTTAGIVNEPLPARERLTAERIHLRTGDSVAMGGFVESLENRLGYDGEAMCEHPGEYAVRGGLVDVFSPGQAWPIRIDFFGDEIDAIRRFDPTTQRTFESVDEVVIHPVLGDAEVDGNGGGVARLIDYLSEGTALWCLVEPDAVIRETPASLDASLVGSATGAKRTFFGWREEGAHRWVGLAELDTEAVFFRGAERLSCVTEPVANYRSREDSQVGVELPEVVQRERTRFEGVLSDWVLREQLNLIFALGRDGERERIEELLGESAPGRVLRPEFRRGQLSGGFRYVPQNDSRARDAAGVFAKGLPEPGRFAVITDDEYLGRPPSNVVYRRGRRETRGEVDRLLDFSELASGDPLVHLQHGICLFRGLQRIDAGGGEREVITVEFAGKVEVHVPLHESHLLSRYVGLVKTPPKLSKLGGGQWEKTRRAAETATIDFAAEMLRTSAEREHAGGHAFAEDGHWMGQFEATFPHEETPDQARAIVETKADMEQSLPMDRLICGDVGFGKTEVALRAAMKAVADGKQVAVLVPTTVLCQQHYQHFQDRMAAFPVLIESVSSFRTAGQNRAALAAAAEGKVDILIGTHRMLSRDVFLPNLGLVIVDEEQRFGVRQKERLKQLRTNVDLLTLSATPIPRTLYLALAGARSMSVIETPPMDRLPIETLVKPFSEELVRTCIEAELGRGGQVFYLHNRVSSIEETAERVRALVPKARVVVGHGQMPEHVLEKVMTKFIARRFDVLVCTTIIESGLNIPNCNTLIIEGADRFGLAQLYQIRGRVGRHNRQAYAYLLLRRHSGLVEKARKRLAALRQHNQLGAGFRIAMRDLELRGAGNLLGSEQSGHIAGVGFELYCQLLRESVSRLKGEVGSDRIGAEVKLDFIALGEGAAARKKVSGSVGFAALKEAEYADGARQIQEAAIPPDYIKEARLRIEVYRRLALAGEPEVIEAMEAELLDRFGKLPQAVVALCGLHRIRTWAERVGVKRVETERERLLCHLARPKEDRAFLHRGNRFPRLTTRDPFRRLEEIERFLKQHSLTLK